MPLSFFSNASGAYTSAVPFQRIVDPAQMGFTLNLEQSELIRIQRYNEGWRFYLGQQWTFKREDGDALVTFNYYRKIIDKGVEFLVSKGFVIRTPESLEQVTKPFLDEVWEYNHRDQIIWDFGTMGSVTGDVFILATYEDPTPMQKRINPFSEGRIRINLLGSEQVFPTWDPLNTDTLIAVRIETIYYAERGVRQLDRDDRVNHEGRQLYTKRFTQIITRDQIVEQFHGDQPVVRPNILGEIPIVHIKNQPFPKEYYGLADGQDLIDVQRELNEKSTDISDIVNYHACVDVETEILTKNGWRRYGGLVVGDEVLGLDIGSDEIVWQPVQAINTYDYDGQLVRWSNRIDALTTPNHRWLADRRIGRPANARYNRQFVRTSEKQDGDLAVASLRGGSRLIVGGGIATEFTSEKTYDDELVELVGWVITEGCVTLLPSGNHVIILAQSQKVNAAYVDEIRRLQAFWSAKGETFTERPERESGVVTWYIGTELTSRLLEITEGKSLPPKFLMALTFRQAERLLKVLLDADGTYAGTGGPVWYQDDQGRVDGFQMLAAMVGGQRTNAFVNIRGNGVTKLYQKRTLDSLSAANSAKEESYTGVVWCPTVQTGTWFARRGGNTYWTGNSPITVVYGAKAKQLERSPRKIWSGLPINGKVEMLRLEGDLTASREYVEFVKKALHELSDTPEGALGAMQPISNTSGVALHMQYQPLIGKTKKKKAQYEPGMEQINYFILRIGMVKGLISLPFDVCSECNGRIIEVETGETTDVWDPRVPNDANPAAPGAFRSVPIKKKRCYHIDPETLDFLAPEEMRIKYWRQYGFGAELREMQLKQILDEIQNAKRSYWDYTVLQEMKLDQWRSDNESAITGAHAKHVKNVTPPKPKPTPKWAKDEPEEQPEGPYVPPMHPALIPQVNVAPPKVEPPPMFHIHPLPDGEIDIPEEPETVLVAKTFVSPETGQIMKVVNETKFLVPTGCKRPKYLNPFESKVEFNDVLPKDEALQAQLFSQYQANEWVDAEWCQERIPEIARDMLDINKRIKARKAEEQRLAIQTQGGTQPAATMPGNDGTPWTGDNAPEGENINSVPGPGGNPVPLVAGAGGGNGDSK